MTVSNLKSAFEDQVAASPQHLAVMDTRDAFTFEQLNRLANAIASLVESSDASDSHDGSCVGIILGHSAYLIAAMFGVLKTGRAYVALEADFPPKRIHHILAQADVKVVITTRADSFLAEDAKTICLDEPDVSDHLRRYLSGKDSAADVNPSTDIARGSAAYYQFTSGTTGLPKGFVISHGNVLHYARAFRDEFHPGPSDRILQTSVCTFDMFVEEVFPTLLSGGTIAVAEDAMRGDFSRLYGFIERNGVTIISAFPYLIARFNSLGKFPASLRLMISGGDVLRYRYVDKLLGRVEIYNTYGPSEATVCATYFRCRNASDALEDGTLPVGTEVTGTSIFICDSKGHHLPDGQEGEICIEGDGLTSGYIGLPEETAAAFVSDPENGVPMYRSGDMGIRRDDGVIIFLYRKDEQVMIEGRRVEPMEVENVLSHCPGIRQAVVMPHFDEDGLAYLTAYIVADKPPRVKLSTLHEEMSRELPDFMIPEYTVLLPEMPVGANGKISRTSLPLIIKDVSKR